MPTTASEVDRENLDSEEKNMLQCGLCFPIVDSLQQLGSLDPSVRNYENLWFPINQSKIYLYSGHLQCNLVCDRAHERFNKSDMPKHSFNNCHSKDTGEDADKEKGMEVKTAFIIFMPIACARGFSLYFASFTYNPIP